MSVTIIKKSNMNILKLFKCSDEYLKQFSALGGSVSSSEGLLVFSQKGQPLSSVPIKDGVLALIKKGLLGSASQAAIQHKVNKALDSFINLADKNPQKDSTTGMTLMGFDMAKKIPPFELGGSVSGSFESKDSHHTTIVDVPKKINITHALSMKPVKLSQADSMYQPVTSTSAGSIYHVICISGELRVAARVKDYHSISLRVEGKLHKYKKELMNAGFDIPKNSENADYYSIHLKTESKIIAIRTVAAILSIVPDVRTLLPDLSIIMGKGK